MVCPYCLREGRKSMIFPANNLDTVIPFQPFLDPSGIRIAPNPVVRFYACTEGHQFSLQDMKESTLAI